MLERNGIIHGDLSPNNLRVDLSAGMQDPAAYLFDFDAFVAPAAGELGTLTTEDGGVFGTEGYCPPDLHEGTEQAEADIAPYSDRYGRDMLVLELLCYDRSLPFDLPPSYWPREVLLERLQRIGADRAVPYLTRQDLFSIPESERPSAAKLAQQFGMNVPPPIKRRGRPIVTKSRRKAFSSPRGDLAAKTLTVVLALLWVLCSAHWAIISHRVGGWLVGADRSTVAAAGLIPSALRLLASGSLLLAGMYGLACLAFAGPSRQTFELAGYQLELPARRPTGRSELGERGMAALQLAGLLAVLCAVVAAIVRFG